MKSFISNSISYFISSKVHTTRENILYRFYTARSRPFTGSKLWTKDYQASCSALRSDNSITTSCDNKAKDFLLSHRRHISSSGIGCQFVSKVLNFFYRHFNLRTKFLFSSSNAHSQVPTKITRLFSEHSSTSGAVLASSTNSRAADKVCFLKESKMSSNQTAEQTGTRAKNVVDAKHSSENVRNGGGQVSVKSSNKTGSGVVRLSKDPNTIVALHPHDSSLLSLDICLRKADEPGGLITKSMTRDQNELASKGLDRIRMLYTPDRTKGTKDRRLQREDILNDCPKIVAMGIAPSANLLESSSFKTQDQETKLDMTHSESHHTLVELDTTLPNHIFWRHVRLIKLGGEELMVKYNVPTITSIEVPSRCLVGLPLMCTNIEALFVQNEELCYEWCIRQPSVKNYAGGASKKGLRKNEENVHVLSNQPVFIPTEDLLGKSILLRVSPSKNGLWAQVEVPPVQEPPPAMARWQQTTQYVSSPGFRVVTYNILHDDFCTSKYSKTRIYPFAADEVLDIENRKVRILQELLMYHSDLICLQECGQRLFKRFLEPAMGSCGYGAYYKNKIGNAQEGCALLYRKERFELVDSQSLSLNWTTLTEDHPELASRLDPHSELKEALQRVTSIGVVLLLREIATGREVVLGSTHLFYHANACHIRILQAYMLLHRLHRIADGEEGVPNACGNREARSRRPVVLCGDFNFTHSTGAYRLVTTGQVEASHHSWEKGQLFRWGGDRQLGCSEADLLMWSGNEQNAGDKGAKSTDPSSSPVKVADGEKKKDPVKEKVSVVSGNSRPPLDTFFQHDLHAPLALLDAYDRTDPSMLWTNYTLTFREVIDYVFFSPDSIDVLQTVPIPPESELSENHALPNAKYPSDHLALIADLILKQ